MLKKKRTKKTKAELKIVLDDEYADVDLLLADGFEEAFMGVATQFDNVFCVYDYDTCVDILVKRDGMAKEEAIEFVEFNVTGAYVGKATPAFLKLHRPRP